jgi:hypothetical protein
MKKGIILVAATLMSFALIVGGAYVTINNAIHPQGNLFEGIMGLSIGLIMLLVASMVNTLNNTIKLFVEVFDQQVSIQTKVQKEINRRNEEDKMSPGVTFLDMSKPGAIPPEALEKANEMFSKVFSGAMGGLGKKSLEDMNLEELDNALQKALDKDDYERASKIRDLIKEKNNPGEAEPDDDSEESPE